MEIKVNIDAQALYIKLGRCQETAQKAMAPIYNEFVKNTPVKSGNARRNTTLTGSKIHADYKYASVLNDGRGFRDGQMRGSEQAPQGMFKPTVEFAKRLIKQLIQQQGK
jgi:hypothetical protein